MGQGRSRGWDKGWSRGWGKGWSKEAHQTVLTLHTRAIREIQFCVEKEGREEKQLMAKETALLQYHLLRHSMHPHTITVSLLKGHKHKV